MIINKKNKAVIESVKSGNPQLIFDVFFSIKHPDWVKVIIAGKDNRKIK